MSRQGTKAGVLAFTRLELEILGRKLGSGAPGGLMFGLARVVNFPQAVLVGPLLGAPMAVMALEELARKGVGRVVGLGWCGSLSPELMIGDILLPDSAFSQEGTSAHYPVEGGGHAPHEGLAGLLAEGLNRAGTGFRRGAVLSTDAPFRETRELIERHRAAGALAVDMEAAALMRAARFLELEYACLMVVSDLVWPGRREKGFGSARLKAALTLAAEAIITIL